LIESALNDPELKWENLQLKRGDFLIRSGEIERYFYFVESGALRAFAFAEKEEFTLRFGYSGSIITSLPSYFNGRPSETYIQAIRKSKLLRCHKTQFESFVQKSPDRLLAYQKVLQELVTAMLEREIDLLHQAPANRLERVIKRSPQLFQEVPHKYIAHYLRMSPETLSRLLKS
jgi:CRP-like cAMP-binding protein